MFSHELTKLFSVAAHLNPFRFLANAFNGIGKAHSLKHFIFPPNAKQSVEAADESTLLKARRRTRRITWVAPAIACSREKVCEAARAFFLPNGRTLSMIC
jgi:hypothetical protein